MPAIHDRRRASEQLRAGCFGTGQSCTFYRPGDFWHQPRAGNRVQTNGKPLSELTSAQTSPGGWHKGSLSLSGFCEMQEQSVQRLGLWPRPSTVGAAVEWTASPPESTLSRPPQSRGLMRYASILLCALALRHIVRDFSACLFEIQPIYPSCPSMSLC